jgi:hypothetical protein
MAFEKQQGAGNNADLASKSFLHDCVPNAYTDFAVTTAAAESVDLTPFAGKRIWMKAITGDITYLRGVHATMTTAQGISVATTDQLRDHSFWVDPGEGVVNSMAVRAGASVTLRIYYCSDL